MITITTIRSDENMKSVLKISTICIVCLINLTRCTNEVILPNQYNGIKKAAQSNRITEEEAINYAQSVLNQLDVKSRSENKIISNISYYINRECRTDADIDTAMYLINYENGGFALLGADARLPRLFAISECGSLCLGDESSNPGLSIYFDILRKTISLATTQDVSKIENTPFL